MKERRSTFRRTLAAVEGREPFARSSKLIARSADLVRQGFETAEASDGLVADLQDVCTWMGPLIDAEVVAFAVDFLACAESSLEARLAEPLRQNCVDWRAYARLRSLGRVDFLLRPQGKTKTIPRPA